MSSRNLLWCGSRSRRCLSHRVARSTVALGLYNHSCTWESSSPAQNIGHGTKCSTDTPSAPATHPPLHGPPHPPRPLRNLAPPVIHRIHDHSRKRKKLPRYRNAYPPSEETPREDVVPVQRERPRDEGYEND